MKVPKRLVLLVFAALLAPSCSTSAPVEKSPVSGKLALEHVKKMVSYGPHPAGSAALLRVRDYIRGELRKMGLKPELDSFTSDKAKGIQFHNIVCRIPGTRKGEKRVLLLASHYDSKKTQGHPLPEQNFRFVGANDGGSSSGLLLEVARYLKAHPLPVEVRCVWFDGEESIPFDWGEGEMAMFGSKHYIKKLRKEFPKEKDVVEFVPVMILLDMVGAKDLSISLDTNSDMELVRIVANTAKRLGYQKYFFREKTQVTDDHIPFQNYGISVLDLIQFGGERTGTPTWWHTERDDLTILSAKSLEIVGHTLVRSLPDVVKKFYK